MIGRQLELGGWFWDRVTALNDNFGALGFGIIGVFVAAWLISAVLYRYSGLDRASPPPIQ